MRLTHTTAFTLSLILCLQLARSEDHHKRAPSGFTGVRGKKSLTQDPKTSLFYEDDEDVEGGGNRGSPQLPIPASGLQFPSGVDGDVSKRARSMGFVGMRGKKPWEGSSVLYGRDNDRAPKRSQMGFFGMRGKRDDDVDPLSYELEKRMNAGFFGMRGKKENDLPDQTLYMSEKRAPSMGFVGMRGRKNFDDSVADLEKRTPSGFFGMRGKKQWAQFALRGKKMPYNFRGKFVGVRGKKAVFNNDDGNFETEPNYDLDMNQLLMQLMEEDNKGKTGADFV